MSILSIDDLRRTLIEGIDSVLDRPLRRAWLTSEQRRVLKAQRAFWESADQTTLEKAYSLFRSTGKVSDSDDCNKPDGTDPCNPDDPTDTVPGPGW